MHDSVRSTGYSAQVVLQLIVQDRLLKLGQIGPGLICLREPVDLPPCDATVVMTVDGHRREWPVYLPEGLSANSREARTIDREPARTSA